LPLILAYVRVNLPGERSMSGRNEIGAPPALNDNAFVIGPNVRIDGRIDFDGPIWLRAPFEGIINCRSLLVDVGASCLGVIVAEKVAVRGTVDAEIYAGVLELRNGCAVTGAAYHSELLLEPGAQFEGKSRRIPDAQKVGFDRLAALDAEA
jgi:cytoskeletal protein CcmA (bactofilin family)